MMVHHFRLALLMMSLAIWGCSGDQQAAADNQPSQPALFQDQIETIDKALQVEKLMHNSSERNQRAMDEL